MSLEGFHSYHSCDSWFASRRGLAMLELTLALPILLFIMALIVNYGAMASWKAREHSIARLAVWETRWPRSGGTNPRPEYWPPEATLGCTSQGTAPGLDDGRVDQQVARGPLPAAAVNSDLLDPTRGLREGSAEYTSKFPLLGKLGTYTIEARTWLLDDKWQYQRMCMGSNWLRRIPVIYALAKAPPSLVSSYVQSVLAVIRAPFRAQLAPLDRDPDFIYFGQLFGWGGPPDFQPRLRRMCTTDRKVTDKAVGRLIDRIQGRDEGRRHIPSVAETMARSFLSLYQRALSAFEAIVEAKPPAPPQMVALANSQMSDLKAKIEILKSFLETIKAGSGG